MLYHEVAALSALLTFSMFFTPSSFSHASKAFPPFSAKIGMPSFQVARPQSTPLNFTPASFANSRSSMNSALLTPADR